MTSGPAVENPSAGGGLTGSFMLLRFNPADAPTATVIDPALSPFPQQRGDAPGGISKPCPSQRIAMPGQEPPSGLEAALRGLRQGVGVDGHFDHLRHPAVAVKRDVA